MNDVLTKNVSIIKNNKGLFFQTSTANPSLLSHQAVNRFYSINLFCLLTGEKKGKDFVDVLHHFLETEKEISMVL